MYIVSSISFRYICFVLDIYSKTVMQKKIIRLTEDELRQLIKEATVNTLKKIDGKTYARIHNSTMQAQKNQLAGIPNINQRKSNTDVIMQGIRIDPEAADSLIKPYKTSYLFHCQNLRGTAALTVFKLEQLYELTPQKAILKGEITFNNERLYGSIIINLSDMTVYYIIRGKVQNTDYLLTHRKNNYGMD